MTIKNKAIFAIMLIFITLSGVLLLSGIHRYRSDLETRITDNVLKANRVIEQVIHNINESYTMIINSMVENKEIIQPFNLRDRNLLYEKALPFHNQMKNDNPHYSNMHFHLPGGTSFLRMHKPREFGDDMSNIRPVIMAVHKFKTPQGGYEVGKHGLFYRVVRPVFYDGLYIGALEFGIKDNEAAENIEQIMNVKTGRYIPEDFLNDGFKKYCTNEIKAKGLSINPYQNNLLFKKIFQKRISNIDHPQKIMFNTSHLFFYRAGNLNDFSGKKIAGFLLLQDITQDVTELRQFILYGIILTISLITGAFFILNFSFGKMITQIVRLNSSLEEKVALRTEELEQTSQKLNLSNIEMNQIFNTATNPMRIIDKHFKVIKVNDTFASFVGEKKENIIGKNCHEGFSGPFCFKENCTLKRILNGMDKFEADVDKVLDDGSVRSFILTATPYTNHEGELIGVVENFKDISYRKQAEDDLREKEEYLSSIMKTIQTGVLIVDDETQKITAANPFVEKMTGYLTKELVGTPVNNYINIDPSSFSDLSPNQTSIYNDVIIKTHFGKKINARTSIARIQMKKKNLLVISLLDITDIKTLLEKQEMDVGLAKQIMSIVNPSFNRYTRISEELSIFSDALFFPCYAEGGDHYFIQSFTPNGCCSGSKTIISLKDQSGHEVSCILRSIITDILHNAILNNVDISFEKSISMLNNILLEFGIFRGDEFFTSINASIDHEQMELTYVSTGHLPFLLIRNNEVFSIPEDPSQAINLPIPVIKDMPIEAGKIKLQPCDQLIFYTDGLTEMPFKRQGKTLSTEELTQIVAAFMASSGEYETQALPISQMIRYLLRDIAEFSGESISEGSPPVNTSEDDISIIGIEIEKDTFMGEKTFIPSKSQTPVCEFIKILYRDLERKWIENGYEQPGIRLRSVLEETILNAYKHGNKKHPDRSITVRWNFRNDFHLQVEDEGTGFDFNSPPDPTHSEKLSKTSGRGIFIIRYYSDNIHWGNKGKKISVLFNKESHISATVNQEPVNIRFNLWHREEVEAL